MFNFENVAVLPLWGLSVVAPQWVGREDVDVTGDLIKRMLEGTGVVRIVGDSPLQRGGWWGGGGGRWLREA